MFTMTTAAGAVAASTTAIIVVRYDASGAQTWVNGQLAASITSASYVGVPAVGVDGTHLWKVGNTAAAYSAGPNGVILDTFAVAKYVDDTELADLFTYSAAEYGVTL